MATELLELADIDLTSSQRSLLLVWQNPESRRFVRVGQLDVLSSGKFAFHYLPGAFDDPKFFELDEYSDRNTVYVSDELPVFFANRIMSAERPSYNRYLNWLGLLGSEDAQLPIEVLARTGGERVTDTFHIVDMPASIDDGFVSRFFVSGTRYVPEIGEVLAEIGSGDDLMLQLEENNTANPKAVLVNTRDGKKVGYVPDWLCKEVHDLLNLGYVAKAIAERVNVDAPPHVRVLCRIEMHRPEVG